MDRRHFDGLGRAREAVLAPGGDHNRRGAVRAVVRDLLRDVVGIGAAEPDRAHEDQRLGAQVDVLLVLGDVGGDRPVTQLRELDAELVRGDPVEAVPDDGPVPARRDVTERDRRDRLALGEHLLHRIGKRAEVDEELVLPTAGRGRRTPRRARAPAGNRPRSARRRPSSTAPPSRGLDHRMCRARRRTCRRDRCSAGSRSPARSRSGRARGRRFDWCRSWYRSG